MYFLIAARIIQGIAAANILTLSVTIITRNTLKTNRGLFLGYWTLAGSIGIALGPFIGGAITHFLSWRFLFLFNIPLGILALVFLWRLIETQSTNESDSSECQSPTIPLFKNMNYVGACICGFFAYFALYPWLFIFSIYLHKAFHFSPLKIGVTMLAYTVTFAVFTPLAGKIVRSIKTGKITLRIGLLVSCFAFLLMSKISQSTSILSITISFALFAFSIALIAVPSITLAMNSITKDQTSMGSGIMFVLRWGGGIIGMAVTTYLFSYTTTVLKQSYSEALSKSCITIAITAAVTLVVTTFLWAQKISASKKHNS